MEQSLNKLRERYNLKIDSPFLFKVGNESHLLQCRLRGYGAKNGMVIDKDWDKIKAIQQELSDNDFGYSCIDLEIKSNSDLESFEDVLNDWGKFNA